MDKRKLESIDALKSLLEILNEQVDRYVPYEEIEKLYNKRLISKEKDNVARSNHLKNALLYAQGINVLAPPNKKGVPDVRAPHTASYLADVAQIMQTRLIERFDNPTTHEQGYKITISGMELLNQLKFGDSIEKIKGSSLRLENLTKVLMLFTAFLILTSFSILYIDTNGNLLKIFWSIVFGFSLVLVLLITWHVVNKLMEKRF